MVRTRALPGGELEGRAGFEARREHHLLKEIRADEARARAGQEPAAGRHERHREAVDVLVAARRPLHVAPLLREGRRIADDRLPALSRGRAPANVLEHIRPDEVGLLDGKAVGAPVLARELQSPLRGVHVHGPPRATGQRGDRKGAGIREEVQDPPASGDLKEAPPVLSLVEKEPRLLSTGHVGEKMETMLVKRHAASLSLRESVGVRDVLAPSTVVPASGPPEDEPLRRENLPKSSFQLRGPGLDALRRQVENGGPAINVGDHTRAQVPLGVDRAVAGGLRRNDLITQALCGAKSLAEERRVGPPAVERPQARQDLRGWRVGAVREHGPGCVGHFRNPVGAVSLPPGHGARKDPGMAPQDRGFPAGFECQADQRFCPRLRKRDRRTDLLLTAPRKGGALFSEDLYGWFGRQSYSRNSGSRVKPATQAEAAGSATYFAMNLTRDPPASRSNSFRFQKKIFESASLSLPLSITFFVPSLTNALPCLSSAAETPSAV